MLCPAIQMGRPTKYTASAAGCGLTGDISHDINIANSGTSYLSHVVTPWYQVPSWKSLLQQHLLVRHPSLHVADAVNPWIVTSRDVSLSPDSTVKDMEQTSSESDNVRKHQLDALDLCRKSVASAAVPFRSSLMPQLSANISTSSVASAENCARSLHTELARRWLHCSGTSSHMNHSTRHTSDPVLNLSVKSLDLHREKSSSHRTATTSSRADSDSDSSGCVFCFVC